MRGLIGLAFLPLACLVGLILLCIVIYLVVRSYSTKAVSHTKPDDSSESASDTRWSRSDLSARQMSHKEIEPAKVCPACGGSNPDATEFCLFCGRKFF